MKHVLGIDLGGTKVLAGVIDVETGKVLSTAKKRSRAGHGPTDLLERVLDAAHTAIDSSKVDPKSIGCVGVGVAGQIDRKKGIVMTAPNLANMTNTPLADIIEKELKHPVYLFNDVEAAAGGEASFGAGKDAKDFVVIFVGTGIGGMVYRDGKPYGGATNTAGELGHMVVDLNGRVCGCGGLGHLEAYASRTAIVRYILANMHLGRETVLSEVATEINPSDPGGSGIRSGAIAAALAKDDPLVKEALRVGGDYLAAGLVSIINFYNPPLIVLGGGLISAVDPFFNRVAKRAKEGALQVPAKTVEIKKVGLGDYSGIVGAAVLASQKTGKKK